MSQSPPTSDLPPFTRFQLLKVLPSPSSNKPGDQAFNTDLSGRSGSRLHHSACTTPQFLEGRC